MFSYLLTNRIDTGDTESYKSHVTGKEQYFDRLSGMRLLWR